MKKIIIISLCFSLSHSMELDNSILPNLGLDLDDVLLHNRSKNPGEHHQFFSQKSFLVKDSYNYHYVVPAYFPEFLKFATSRFNIAFFSYGHTERNRSVIQDMWSKVFNATKPEHIKIFSHKDLTNNKKDISKIGPLHNTILVDDNEAWILKDQEANFLQAPALSFYIFKIIINNCQNNTNELTLEELLADHCEAPFVLTFYKLLYIAGILDTAAQHETSIVNGLHALQFEGNRPKFSGLIRDLQYYKRGYQVLSKFTDGTLPQYFPEVEKFFQSPANQ